MGFIADQLAFADKALTQAEQAVREVRARYSAIASSILPALDEEKFAAFLKQPYVLIQKRGHEWYCIVPRFVDFSVGWLEFATDSYNVFLVNRYTLWLGDVPESIRQATGLEAPPGDLMVQDGKLLFAKGHRSAVDKYKKHLADLGSTTARVIKGREFQLLAEMIDDGYLPFAPKPVAEKDRREPRLNFTFDGKYHFQLEALHDFMRLGAVGVYWMTGAGKSFFAMAALDSIAGRKLVVVPTKTLIEQWRGYFKQYAPRLNDELLYRCSSGDVEIVTYQAYEKVRDQQWDLILYDEAQRLPANSFSRFATLRTKYRIGLSASPKREDGRENYIVALTGFPIGMDWRSLIKLLGKEYHTVNVWVVTTENAKMIKIGELLNPGVKTIIFCDGLQLGEQIARRYSLPFISGDTRKRMAVAKDSTAFVASRVMDLGVSLADLQHVIEVDFLYGSRQQELQRTGRLFHSTKGARHAHRRKHSVPAFAKVSYKDFPRLAGKVAREALEDELFAQIKMAGLAVPERWVKFHPERDWELDMAYPAQKIAIEVEGGTANGGRHVRPKGYEDDCLKYNEAALLGWQVLRFTSRMIKDGRALALIEKALSA